MIISTFSSLVVFHSFSLAKVLCREFLETSFILCCFNKNVNVEGFTCFFIIIILRLRIHIFCLFMICAVDLKSRWGRRAIWGTTKKFPVSLVSLRVCILIRSLLLDQE